MKILQLKSSVGKQETNGNDNTKRNTKSNTFRKEWNSTTSVSIVQVVLIALLLSLSQSMRIEYGSRKEKDDNA